MVLVPENVKTLSKKGAKVSVVKGGSFLAMKCTWPRAPPSRARRTCGKNDVVVAINNPGAEALKKLENRTIVSQLNARNDPSVYDRLVEQKAT